MAYLKSYWTNRRQIRASVSEHIKVIQSIDAANGTTVCHPDVSASDSLPNTASCHNDVGQYNLPLTGNGGQASNSDHEDQLMSDDIRNSFGNHYENVETTSNAELDSESETMNFGHGSNLQSDFDSRTENLLTNPDSLQFEELFRNDQLPVHSDSDQDGDTNHAEDFVERDHILVEKLAGWASEFHIPHVAILALLVILGEYFKFLPKDPRTLLNTVRKCNVKSIAGGLYYHFGVASSISERLTPLRLSPGDIDSVSIQINVDGLPLFKSSNTQLWPILGKLVNPQVREPFIIGIFCGSQKPTNLAEYLAEFVTEMNTLEEEGMLWQDGRIQVKVSCVICDAPAKAYLKQIKGHSGYFGCDKCVQKGVWVGKMTFPQTDANMRSDVQFNEMTDEAHHLGPSPLRSMNLGMVTQFPLDYMHLVCLGVMKRILLLWIRGPIVNSCRIGAQAVERISDSLIEMKNYLPREFLRKGRSLREVDRWKATEFRQFLLYTGPVILLGKVSERVYRNFLLFAVAIYCLSSDSYSNSHCQYAGDLLRIFVEEFGSIYGRDMLVYNVHCLVHLADDVKRFGSLDRFSAFPFESFLGKLKRMVRQPNLPLQQIIRRLSERKASQYGVSRNTVGGCGVLKKPHMQGPLTMAFRTHSQYREIHFPEYCISICQPDNCVQIDDKVAVIRNIVSVNEQSEPYVIYEELTDLVNFFEHPLNSSDLGIHMVGSLTGQISEAPISLITCKYVVLPYRHNFVAIPLIHTC